MFFYFVKGMQVAVIPPLPFTHNSTCSTIRLLCNNVNIYVVSSMKRSWFLVRKANDSRNHFYVTVLKGSTAFCQIVERVHETEKIGNHCPSPSQDSAVQKLEKWKNGSTRRFQKIL